MKMLQTVMLCSAVLALAACATTPEQKAARAEAQKRYEQNLQVALAGQCDKDTAELMRQQFNPPEGQTEKRAPGIPPELCGQSGRSDVSSLL